MRVIRWFHRTVCRRAAALTAVFLGILVPTALSAGEEDGGSAICEKAFNACLFEALAKAGGWLDMGLFYHLQFCAIGYSFCERFVDAFLSRR